MFFSDVPPPETASLAFSIHCFACARISTARSPSPMTPSTHRLSSSRPTTASPPIAARTPTPARSSTSHATVGWSVHCGTATIGTPCVMLSSAEFHPQCVTKHPTAWPRVSSSSWCLLIGSMVPNDTYTTERAALVSSHSMYSAASPRRAQHNRTDGENLELRHCA
nr:unnamed protein product [Digitaria exilis]